MGDTMNLFGQWASGPLKMGSQIMGGIAQKQAQYEQARVLEQEGQREVARSQIMADEYRRRESLAAARGRAIRSASGVDPNTGTARAVDEESAKEGEFGAQQYLDEGRIRSFRLKQEADLRKRAGKSAEIAGYIGAATTFLTMGADAAAKGWGSNASELASFRSGSAARSSGYSWGAGEGW